MNPEINRKHREGGSTDRLGFGCTETFLGPLEQPFPADSGS
jgi:hypothetical protein